MEVFEGTPNQRCKIIEKVQQNQVDLLLATYDRVASVYGKERAVNGWGYGLLNLFDTAFNRVILDEAQVVRNPSSKKYKGTMHIAKFSRYYRVALTGIPLVSEPTVIYSLLAFVEVEPWDDASAFRTYITNPIRDRKKKGLTTLCAALTYVAFRRTKSAVKDLMLPLKTVELVRIAFPEEEHKKLHDHFFDKTMGAFDQTEKEPSTDSANKKFEMQMKLRQSCASGAMVVPEGMEHLTFGPAPKIFALVLTRWHRTKRASFSVNRTPFWTLSKIH